MKTDDIFEALTDIDDKYIANAHPAADTDQIMVAAPAPKKPLWKTLVPIAACLAVLCAAGAFGAKYYTERLRSNPSESGSASFSQLAAYTQKVTRIDIPDDGSEAGFTMEEFPAFDFKVSQKSVNATFKTTPEMDIAIANQLFDEDEKIHILNLYLADLDGDGKREICATIYDAEKGEGIMVHDFDDGLMNDAENSGVIVDLAKGSLYSLPSDGKEFEYSLEEEDGVLKAVKTVWQPAEMSMIPNEISREPLTLDMMMRIPKATDFKQIAIPRTGVPNDFTMEEFPTYYFTATSNKIILNGAAMNNVDVPIISGDSIENLYLCDLNGDGRRELCATVLNDGIRSVDVVNFAKYKWYTLQGSNGHDLRRSYSLEAENEKLKLVVNNHAGSCLTVTSEPLSLDMLTPILSNTGVIKIDTEKTFKLVEFPDKTFEITKHSIVMSDITTPDAMIRPVISGIEYYLADLNGDGNHEICCWGSIGSGIVSSYITVYDIANDEFYYFKAERPSDKWFSLDVKDGELYAVTSEYYVDEKELSREPLSLDILEKVEKSDTAYEEIPLFYDQTFIMDDFPGFSFTVNTTYDYTQFSFRWGSNGVSNHVNSVYLYDIDGDGKREIAMNCPFAGNGCIRVYGFMDNGEIGEAVYFEDGGCWLNGDENGTLMYYTNDKIEPFKFSKSDLKPSLAQGYSYQLLDWDHTLDFSGIAPVFNVYDMTIKDRTLKITCKDEVLFDSGIQLIDLYSIPDKENHSLILVFTTEHDGGTVSALKISEKDVAKVHHFEKGVTLKPTTDELLLVNADGSEKPFDFPETGNEPLQ
ncbi:MAG: hypothetical protein K2J80_03510 [Oscillospiraceae bacterium]|nr:hypothetical protein [Oscillospiraceae bacterium]